MSEPWECNIVEWEYKFCLCARNVPISELNELVNRTGGYLDVDAEELVLADLKVVERI